MGQTSTQDDHQSLTSWLEAYDWLFQQLVPIFGAGHVILAEADAGHKVGLAVFQGTARHAMWVENETDYGRHYSLNVLPESQRETVVRHFIQDAKEILGWPS